MNNNTNSEGLIQEIQNSLSDKSLVFRPEAAHIVEIPTPLTYSIISGLYSFQGSLGQAYKALDLPITEYNKSDYVRYYIGRIYLDLHCEEEFLHKAMGMEYTILEGIPTLQKSKKFANILKVIKNVLSNSYVLTQMSTHIAFAQEILGKLKTVQAPELNNDKNALISSVENEIQSFYNEYSAIFRLAYIEGLLSAGITKEGLAQLSATENPEDIFVASNKIWDSTNMTQDEVVTKFGNRSFNDFELSAPRWYEDTQVIGTLLTKRADPIEKKVVRSEVKITQNIEQLQKIIVLKDNLRFSILNRVNNIRQYFLKLGDVLGIGTDIFYLPFESIKNDSPEQLKEKAHDSKSKYEAEKTMYAPDLLTKAPIRSNSLDESGDKVSVTPVSVGKVEGKLSIVTSPTDTPSNGTILVLPTAGPEYTHLYHNAIGILFLSGGVLSHGSIISREMHIPAVIGKLPSTTDANHRVILDATNGTLTF